MPFITSIGSASLFGFNLSAAGSASNNGGGNQPYTGTLYYYEGADETDTTSTWATLAKWYKNSSHTQAAPALPTASNATVLLNNTSADLETWTAPASIDISGKSLTLNAHAQQNGCASAVEFNTPITATSSSNLILSGHITVTGVNHPLYTFNYITSTYYYFDADLDINSYIYQSQYSNTVAAVAISFTAELAGDFYTIGTDSTGKVITKEIFTIDNPDGDTSSDRDYNNEVALGGIVGFSKYAGYISKFTNDVCPPSLGTVIDLETAEFKLFLPPSLAITSASRPVYRLAVRDAETNELVYSAPTPYAGDFTYLDTANDQYKLYSTDQYGYITGYTVCQFN
jgi:hypothetical protein